VIVRALEARDVLRLWETCAVLHPLDRVLAMLRAGSPEGAADDLAALPIGERERRAVALRVATFGLCAEGVNECPACGLAHEIDPPLTAMLAAPPATAGPFPVVAAAHEVVVRVPDSRDQAALTDCADAAEALDALLRRCVLTATCGDEVVAPAALPEEVVAALARELALRDANAETLIELACAQCEHRWTMVFDAGEFLWAEIAMRARRLLHEVDTLARAYHWSEADVLSMTARRREAYLELVGA
jgi:hypothetical protein